MSLYIRRYFISQHADVGRLNKTFRSRTLGLFQISLRINNFRTLLRLLTLVGFSFLSLFISSHNNDRHRHRHHHRHRSTS